MTWFVSFRIKKYPFSVPIAITGANGAEQILIGLSLSRIVSLNVYSVPVLKFDLSLEASELPPEKEIPFLASLNFFC